MEYNVYKVNKFIKRFFTLGIIIVILMGTLFHFVYDFTKLDIIGVFVPVNESVFEHLKLIIWPILIYVYVGYFIYRNKYNIDSRNFFYNTYLSIYISIAIVLSGYYIVFGMFGRSSVIFDIALYMLSIVISFRVIIKNYINKDIKPISEKIIFYSIILTIVLVSIFTFFPPKIPFFFDSKNNIYGIRG